MIEEINFTKGFIFKISLLKFILSGMILSYPSLGQEGSFINTKGGFEHIASRDIGMSPLGYAGSGFFAGISLEKNAENQDFHISGNFSKGQQQNRYGGQIQYNKGSFRVFSFYHKNKSSTNQLLWGWFMNNLFSHRYNPEFVNFMDHYEFFTNLGPAVKYLFPFQLWDRDFTFEGITNIQLLGLMVRPSYTSSYPVGFLSQGSSVLQKVFYSSKFSHPGNTWNFGIRPKLSYQLNSGNSLSLGYQYEYYKLNTPNPVTQSNGIWFFGLYTRLK